MSFYQNLLIELLKIVPFFIIGLITAYIAYRQYKIEKSNLNKDLHRTRYSIYKAIEKIDYLLVVGEKIDVKTLHEVTFDINERHFVLSEKLNKKISDFLMELWDYATSRHINKIEPKKSLIDMETEIRKSIVLESKIEA